MLSTKWSSGVMECWSKKHYSITLGLHLFLRSRCQTIDLPTLIRLSCVTKSVVQTVATALPEFDPIGFEPITAPVRRQWNRLVTEALRHLCHARIQDAAPVEHLALTRGPCAQLATNWARMKISQRFFARGFLHFSAD